MKPAFLALFILSCASSAFAAETSPAQAPAAPGVLLMPFVPLGDIADANQWIGRGIQQNLASELGRLPSLRILLPPQASLPTLDAAALRKLAGEQQASYVIFGSYQMGRSDVRITGNVLDVKTGTFVSGLKMTGLMRDLFALEDVIAGQARRILSQQLEGQQDKPPATAPADNAEPILPQQAIYNSEVFTPHPYSSSSDYRRAYYNYNYSPGYYGYGYYYAPACYYGYGYRYAR